MKNNSIWRDFVSYEDRKYDIKIGKTVASSLTGFIIGAMAANIVWSAAVKSIFIILGQ